MTGREVSERWPYIKRFLRVDVSTGWVEDDYLSWFFINELVSLPCVEVAAAYEEWADFYEFQLEQRAEELAGDDHKRGLVEEWTDSMTYCARRCAAEARGEDPGEWVHSWERRPDLYAAKEARVAKIIAELDTRERTEAPVQHLRKVGYPRLGPGVEPPQGPPSAPANGPGLRPFEVINGGVCGS